jgi:hypothetical protein
VFDIDKPIAEAVDAIPDIRKILTEPFHSQHKTDVILKHLESVGLTPLNPGKGDRFVSFLIHSSSWRAIYISLAFISIGLLNFVIAALEGNFFNSIKDIGYWDLIIALTAVVLTLCLYFGKLPWAILELILSNTIELSTRGYYEFKRTAENIYENRFIVWCPYITGLAAAILTTVIFGFRADNTWQAISFSEHKTVAGWITPVLSFALYYLITVLALRILVTFFILMKFFEFPTNIQPLHPDSCGGLYPLGSLSMKLNFGTFLFGLITAMGVLANIYTHKKPVFYPLNVLMVFSYFVCAVIIFFLPLYAAHRRMKEAKYQTLHDINKQFEKTNKELLVNLKEARKVNKAKVSELESLRKMYEIASKMPVYPFNLQIITSFLGSIIAPTIVFLLQKCINSVLIALKAKGLFQ